MIGQSTVLWLLCVLLAYEVGRQIGRRRIKPLTRELKIAKRDLERKDKFLEDAAAVINSFVNPLRFRIVPPAPDNAPDPAGVRQGFFKIERLPLFEITRQFAEELNKEGTRVYLHPFDPLEIDHFDSNGFQCWARNGMYRVEGVRFYTDLAALPVEFLAGLAK